MWQRQSKGHAPYQCQQQWWLKFDTCLLIRAIATAHWLGINSVQALFIGLLTSATALAGDLLASYYKWITRIKDYSHLVKGQSGFLDRFDSFIMTGFWYALVHILTGSWMVSPYLNTVLS